MKERPIIFNTEMIQAILDDRKSQTRRVIKPQPKIDINIIPRGYCTLHDENGNWKIPRYGKIGDKLWVRETFHCYGQTEIIYKADNKPSFHGWTPSIFMPRIASRITLEITNIRPERVQDITTREAIKEGVKPDSLNKAFGTIWWKLYDTGKYETVNPIKSFQTLWDSINAKRGYPYKSNPWVWVIQFKKELKQ